jgi:hypothetical protein
MLVPLLVAESDTDSVSQVKCGVSVWEYALVPVKVDAIKCNCFCPPISKYLGVFTAVHGNKEAPIQRWAMPLSHCVEADCSKNL